ncbi:3-hydroxyacyl-CoA dehydrogenase [Desulfotomaculum arcticum]|uniref:3-hydroxyacyl-CoA dehydrogenase n=1 Tax=Desulfotruncus arcticus DSM 17038 TaxID=1121424 RepID=A0A1I2U797_9FIRM|nr:3-hydroxyacyl-CoA dehydrogenase [Desulfotruncus arcticus]SFG70716.1 3-hydroxyacyl-CoA dehydrogenase [Desulfotomaculum arcticum] [Desulfotruncus arcticus DSM 17038]
MKLSDIKRVLILGAGTMGQQIGLQCAMHGYEVVYYDVSREVLDKAMKSVTKLASWYASTGRLTEEQLRQTLARISMTPDAAEAARGVDLINESVPEDPDLKGKIFARFNKLCPERTIFTTNTSLLLPSMFAQACGRPEKLCALHFHDLRSNNVVDVMPHPGTAPEVAQLVHDFAGSIGQIVITLQKENSGYVFNTMLSSLFLSALTLASRNVTSVEDIDRAWMGVTRMPIGPFGIMDQVGLSTVWDITDYWAKKKGDRQAQANADFLKQYVDKGKLGYKTKQGFYTYPNPAYLEKDFLTASKEE